MHTTSRARAAARPDAATAYRGALRPIVLLALSLGLVCGGTLGCGKKGAPGAGGHAEHAAPPAGAVPSPGGTTPAPPPDGAAPPLQQPPATYAGDLPCADCPAVHTTLTLMADGTYLMRRVYREATPAGDARFIEPGRYSLEANGHTLVLRSGPASTQRFAVSGPHTLEALDNEGRPIPTQANITLTHAPLDAIEDSFAMHGLSMYMADAGRFRECLAGREVAVAQEADNAALERAYTQLASGPGQPVLVALTGHFSTRPRLEGGGLQTVLVVDRFETAIKATSECVAVPDAPLENTYWKVLEVNGDPIPVFDEQRESHLRLTGDGKLAGRGPCNTLAGGYAVIAPDALTFSDIATTRMACAVGMDEEAAMLAALGDVRTYAVHGETLELRASDGHALMRLVAVYF